VARAKVLPAVDENRTLFNDRSSDSVGPLDLLGQTPPARYPNVELSAFFLSPDADGDSFAIAQQTT